MKVEITQDTTWLRVLNAARATVGKAKANKEPSNGWKRQILLAEHSPIKLLEFTIAFKSLRQWVGVHLLRHLFMLPFIHSQRNDRRDLFEEYPYLKKIIDDLPDEVKNDPDFNPRDYVRQGEKNDQDFVVNAQTLINVSRKRLCTCASKETREAWIEVKNKVAELDPIMAEKMVRNCVYRGFCPEPKKSCCGYCNTEAFKKELKVYRNKENDDLGTIQHNTSQEEITYEFVDLGLPSGILWAKCNVGATSEIDYGDYFMFGSTTPNTDTLCFWEHMPFNNGQSSFNEIYFNAHKSEWLNGDVLKPEYDAAHVIMGGNWRMPTKADFDELTSNTTNEWVENYNGSGINGILFTSKNNGNTLFIPAAGLRYGFSFYDQGDYGRVWSSVLYTGDSSSHAWRMGFYSDNCSMDNHFRYFGFSVRGVRNK